MRLAFPDKSYAATLRWRIKNRNTVRKWDRERYPARQANLTERERTRKYVLNRLIVDESFRIKNRLSARIREALKWSGARKGARTMELLGCDIPSLKRHIESQFSEGMTWKNQNMHGWHIDHIRPCSSFDLKSIDQQKECFNYNNLQPLWAADNLRKGNKHYYRR